MPTHPSSVTTTEPAAPTDPSGPALVLYDEDCGFCIWTVGVFLRLDRRHRLRPTPIQRHRDDLLAGRADALDSWHLAVPGRPVTSGGDALADVLRIIPATRPVGAVLARTPRLRRRLYAAVAGRRGRLAHLVPERAKARARRHVGAVAA